MGKGDQRSRRGKIWRGTFGKRRPRKSNLAAQVVTAPSESETKPPKRIPKPATKAVAPKAAVPEASMPETSVPEASVPEAADSASASDSPAV